MIRVIRAFRGSVGIRAIRGQEIREVRTNKKPRRLCGGASRKR